MLKLISTEIRKLNRSLVLLILFGIPAMMFILETTIIATGNTGGQWMMVAMAATGIYAFFLFPMTVTAVMALQAQLEHASGLWSHTLAQPISRIAIFAAKALVSLAIMSVITALMGIAIILGGIAGGLLSPEHAPTGDIPVLLVFELLSKMMLAGLFMMAIQFVVSMRFSSFAIPVVVGIGGTFVGVVATSARQGIYFPWLLAVNVQASDPARAQQAILTGLIGGLVVFALGCVWLARRDWK